MSNVYRITQCPECKHVFDKEESDSIMLHGAVAMDIFYSKLRKEKKSLTILKKEFCAHCGEHIPCGCGNPCSQG